MSRLNEINAELKELNRRHHELLQEKRRLLAQRPARDASETSQYWVNPIFTIIEAHPGASREKIINELYTTGVEIPWRQLTNTLTTLRRRGWIENRGTKKRPEWHSLGRLPRSQWNTRERTTLERVG